MADGTRMHNMVLTTAPLCPINWYLLVTNLW